MRRSRLQDENPEGDVDMTPMLDIVFILLIFFIVTTSFVREEGLVVNRPKAQNSQNNNDSPTVVVQIDAQGSVKFNGKRVDLERLSARIESFLAENQTTSAVVIAEFDTTHDVFVQVVDQIKAFDQLTISIGKSKK